MYVVNGSDGRCIVAVRLIVGVRYLERPLREVLLFVYNYTRMVSVYCTLTPPPPPPPPPVKYIIRVKINVYVCDSARQQCNELILKYEPCLNLPPYLRVPLARLRTSAHGLKIETGRYTIPNPTPVEERLCGVTEDEVFKFFTASILHMVQNLLFILHSFIL